MIDSDPRFLVNELGQGAVDGELIWESTSRLSIDTIYTIFLCVALTFLPRPPRRRKVKLKTG
jgi:hypothetical protein